MKNRVWQGGTERVEEYAEGMGKVHRIYARLWMGTFWIFGPKRQAFENRNNNAVGSGRVEIMRVRSSQGGVCAKGARGTDGS